MPCLITVFRHKPTKTVSAESLLEDITYLTSFKNRLAAEDTSTPHKNGRLVKSVNTVAGFVWDFISAEPLMIKKIQHENDDIFKNELNKRCRKFLSIR
jgi:hypothetical protein